MKESEKTKTLQDNHFSEWLKQRHIVEDELSQKQSMFCLCGKLATGLHERNCKKFNLFVNKETMKKMKHLL